MPLYGCARVSTLDQDLAIQRAVLKAAGCEVIRAEKASGTRRDGRSELQVLLDFLRSGDITTLPQAAGCGDRGFPTAPPDSAARSRSKPWRWRLSAPHARPRRRA